jgi:hypothetical protein
MNIRRIWPRLLSVGMVVMTGVAATAATASPATAEPGTAAVASSGADHVLSVFGAGPYRFGERLAKLTAAGLVDAVVTDPNDPGSAVAISTGDWAGELVLVFRRARLIEIETATDTVRTLAGARVGLSFEDLERIYGRWGRLIANDQGRQAYLVRVGPMVILFGGHPIRPGVGSISVGPAAFTLHNFLVGPVGHGSPAERPFA